MYISFSLTLQSTYKKASNILQNVNTNITESVDTASVPFVPRKLGHFDKQVLFALNLFIAADLILYHI